MKKIILLISFFLLCGCSDYIEINEICLISGIIMDYKDNKYILNTEVIVNEEKSKTIVYKTKGESVSEALLEISKQSDKELFLAHLKVLVISKNVLESNINYTDYFLRNPKLKLNFHIFYTDDVKKISEINKDGIFVDKLMLFNNELFSTSSPLTFTEMINKNVEYGKHNVFPKISVKEKKLILDGNVFINNKNEIYTLNDEESLFYNIVNNKSENSIINVTCDNNYFAITVNSSNSNIKYKNNTIYIDVNINGKLNYYDCKYDIDDNKNVDILNEFTNIKVKNNIISLINVSKENNADILGLSNVSYKYTKSKEISNLDSLKYVIKVKTNINSIGEKRT